jgi:hypothetical protein
MTEEHVLYATNYENAIEMLFPMYNDSTAIEQLRKAAVRCVGGKLMCARHELPSGE